MIEEILRIKKVLQESQERKAVLSSLMFALLVSALIAYLYKEGLFTSRTQEIIAILIPLGYSISIFVFLLFILRFPKSYRSPRKIVLTLLHIIFLTAGIYNANEYGIIASPIYLWIIIATGIRFGIFYLYFSLISSMVAIGILIAIHPYWSEQWFVSMSIMLSLVLVSLSYMSLVQQMHKSNALLNDNLKKMSHNAKHDFLTSLPNRFYFQDILLTRIKEAKKHGDGFGLIFIDLDHFKDINDKYGHQVGDDVLKEVANRIQNIGEKHHFAARLSGDEFVVICETETIEPILQQLLEALRQPYLNDINSLSASIGVSKYIDEDLEDEEVAYRLKKRADQAMYKVKVNGKNNFYIYENN